MYMIYAVDSTVDSSSIGFRLKPLASRIPHGRLVMGLICFFSTEQNFKLVRVFPTSSAIWILIFKSQFLLTTVNGVVFLRLVYQDSDVLPAGFEPSSAPKTTLNLFSTTEGYRSTLV